MVISKQILSKQIIWYRGIHWYHEFLANLGIVLFSKYQRIFWHKYLSDHELKINWELVTKTVQYWCSIQWKFKARLLCSKSIVLFQNIELTLLIFTNYCDHPPEISWVVLIFYFKAELFTQKIGLYLFNKNDFIPHFIII